MKPAESNQSKIRRLDTGDWLARLMTDVQREVALQPTAPAVQRMRARLITNLQAPEKAAA